MDRSEIENKFNDPGYAKMLSDIANEIPFRGFSKETLDIIIKSIVLKSSKPFMADNIVEDFSVTRGETSARNLALVFFDASIKKASAERTQ